MEGFRALHEPDHAGLTSLSHPSLAWPSTAADMPASTVTIYSDSGRPFGLGGFVRAARRPDGKLTRGSTGNISEYAADNEYGATWHLVLALQGFNITDDRDKLSAGEWVIRLLVGADDGDARRYDVHVAWDGDPAQTPQAVLDSALERLAVIKAR